MDIERGLNVPPALLQYNMAPVLQMKYLTVEWEEKWTLGNAQMHNTELNWALPDKVWVSLTISVFEACISPILSHLISTLVKGERWVDWPFF